MNGVPHSSDDALTHERFILSVLARYALAVVMTLCLALAFIDLAQRLMPALPGGLFMVFSLIVSVEAMYAARMLSQATVRESVYGRSSTTYRIAEWVFIVLSLKLALYSARGLDRLWFDLASWQSDMALFFMDGEYLTGLFLMVLVWSASTLFAGSLSELDADPRTVEAERAAGVRTERASARHRLADQIFLMGGAIVVMMILAHVRPAPTWTGFGHPQPVSAYVMVYFTAALGLLAITQFTMLRAGWLWERMPIARGLGQRWIVAVVMFLVGLVILALALPTGYSVGALGLIGYLIALLASVVQLLSFLLMQLIFLIGAWIASLFGAAPPEQPSPVQQLTLEQPTVLNDPAAPDPLWEALKSFIFWAIFAAVALYSVSQLVQLRQDWLARLRQLPALAKLLRGWRRLWAQLRGAGRRFVVQVVEFTRALAGPTRRSIARGAPGFVSVRRMSPRQQVVFFYLAMLRRSAQHGYTRPPSQTPYEYARRLQGVLPEAADDVGMMTAEFVEARYSAHEIAGAQVGLVRRAWEHVKAALRRVRRPSSEERS
ncbi:MAG: DUF4129 domain-containing protein [Anaerolineae bacterium]|nr:DUF4129 domain-containing protein [Thermoflexales bacterium]MDW8407671.1 DUF4129 domain-containing protein [Anaerolineae bacterium]